jgi:hypothetical protein
VTIRDLSATGFRVQLPHCEELLEGEFVRILVSDQDEYVGHIKWALGQEAGGNFV